MGWAGACPKGIRLKAEALARRTRFREACIFPTTIRAQAPGPIPKETVMRFYNQPHAFYCGVDLHARTMYLCILDHGGRIVLHKDLPAEPAAFLEAIMRVSATASLQKDSLHPLAERQAATQAKKLKLFSQRPGCAPLTFETI